MKKIFTGFLLGLLALIHIDLGGGGTLTILPEFVGNLVVLLGVGEMLEWGGSFERAKIAAITMTVYSAAVFVLDIFGLRTSAVSDILSFLFMLMELYMHYTIVKGVGEVETATGMDMNGAKTMKTLKTYMVIVIATNILMLPAALLVSTNVMLAGLGFIILAIAALVVYIMFLTQFFGARTAYWEYTKTRKDTTIKIEE